jgi:hypothetical protein
MRCEAKPVSYMVDTVVLSLGEKNSQNMELYLYSAIYLHGIMLN